MPQPKTSYKDIARSSGVIAVVQVIKIVFGLIQNKVLAVIVGTQGFGIWGMYNTYVEMVSSFSSLGLDSSGVRQIARHADDEISTAKCIRIFKRSLLYISLFATLLSMVLSKQVSRSLFDTPDYYPGVLLVSLVILCNGLSRGNTAILNGLRHIKDLAVSQIIGAVIGAISAIASVLLLGTAGIPLFLIVIGFTAVLSSGWYVRRLRIPKIKPSRQEIQQELKGLLGMGLGFSIAGAMTALATYLSRAYLQSAFDMSAVGIYQAGWTISNVYIGTILTAMGVDFMPRLMKVVGDRPAVNKMVTEQLEFGVLFSSIGVLCILVFSPLVLRLFYSAEFMAGSPIIRWQVLGVAMRIFGFVFGYVVMAHNKPLLFVISQSCLAFADYLLLILFSKWLGFEGLGVNYFVSYLLYILIMFPLCHKIFGISVSESLTVITAIEWIAILVVWFLTFFLQGMWGMFVGSLCIAVYVIWMYRASKHFMHIDPISFIKAKLRHTE